jgi:hypothetical protein
MYQQMSLLELELAYEAAVCEYEYACQEMEFGDAMVAQIAQAASQNTMRAINEEMNRRLVINHD